MVNGNLPGRMRTSSTIPRRQYRAPEPFAGRRRGRGIGRVAALLLLAGLAACAWRGPADDLATQRLTWFDYAGAGDLRAACAAGSRDRYRLIHVADFDRQVRNYDLAVQADGSGRLVQVIDRGVTIDPATETLADILRPARVTRHVPASEVDALARALVADGLVPQGPNWTPPVGRRLVATAHFWLVAACREGRFSLSGVTDPDGAVGDARPGLRVDAAMRGLDSTDIAWPTARPAIDAHSLAACTVEERQRDRSVCFQLQIGEDGLVALTDR